MDDEAFFTDDIIKGKSVMGYSPVGGQEVKMSYFGPEPTGLKSQVRRLNKSEKQHTSVISSDIDI